MNKLERLQRIWNDLDTFGEPKEALMDLVEVLIDEEREREARPHGKEPK